MNVHLFGNGPSPAVATFGLRRTASDGEEKFGKEAAEFVHRNFYVDDGLASLPTGEQAIALIKTTQAMLATANLRLHKIVSNSVEVMEAFPTEDRGKGVRDLDLHRDSLPAQRSLGVSWDLEKDNFTFQVSPPDKPFTRRGVLSIVNSVYDPLGLAAPVLLEGGGGGGVTATTVSSHGEENDRKQTVRMGRSFTRRTSNPMAKMANLT